MSGRHTILLFIRHFYANYPYIICPFRAVSNAQNTEALQSALIDICFLPNQILEWYYMKIEDDVREKCKNTSFLNV